MTDNLYNELSSEELEARFVVESVLKRSAEGRTECVQDPYFPEGERRFIRKYFLTGAQDFSSDWMQQLVHPAFPRVYAHYGMKDETGEYSVLLMEYFSGTTLSELVEATGPFDEQRTFEIMRELCSAVAVLHSFDAAPIIHRDLKPGNIMISGGKVKLIDFGTARTCKEAAARDTRLLGTPGYAAPEQFGFRQSDERTDIYALGMVALFITRGLHPQIEGHQDFAGFLEETLPGGILNEFICRCTQLDPAQRFQSVDEALLELERLSVSVAQPTTHSSTADTVNLLDVTNSESKVKPRSVFTSARFLMITPIFVLLLTIVLVACFNTVSEMPDFGTYDKILLSIQYLALILFIFVLPYSCAISPLSTLKKVGRFGFFKRWWLNYLLIFFVSIVLFVSTLAITGALYSSEYTEWRAEQENASAR